MFLYSFVRDNEGYLNNRLLIFQIPKLNCELSNIFQEYVWKVHVPLVAEVAWWHWLTLLDFMWSIKSWNVLGVNILEILSNMGLWFLLKKALIRDQFNQLTHHPSLSSRWKMPKHTYNQIITCQFLTNLQKESGYNLDAFSRSDIKCCHDESPVH